VRGNVHQVELLRLDYREIALIPCFDTGRYKVPLIIVLRVSLGNGFTILIFCRKVHHRFFYDYPSVLYPAIGRFDESEIVNLGMYTKRRNQTDIRTFRRLNRTQPSVMGIVNVTDLTTCTLTGETARPKGRKTPLVRDFSQWIGLIHELR